MCSLIFYTDANQALVATDTLAVSPDGRAKMFCSKAVHIPHLRTIIAGTGLGGFSNDWANEVNNRFAIKGILNLDYHTPNALRRRWVEVTSSNDFPTGLTTTVYQIGVSEIDEEICAFAYRSKNDFTSEPLRHATRAKPDCTILQSENFVDDIRQMMFEQKEIQDARPSAERIYIGGECILMRLDRISFMATTAFQFDDYEKHLQEMYSSF